MSTPQPITLNLDRRILEHPQALHMRRMRAAIWLYLTLLARLPSETDAMELNLSELAQAMGLPEGTIRSHLGHLRKNRYVDLTRTNGGVRVRVKRLSIPASPEPAVPPRFFTESKLERALGEIGNRAALEAALAEHSDPVIKQALAGALAVPATEIRRSRTALFLYLLKRHAHQ